MKRYVCLLLCALMVVGCFAGCSFTQNLVGSFAENAEATEQVEKMVSALAENRTEDAKALMHPSVAQQVDAGIAQMSAYIAGRSASSVELTNIRISSSTGTAGSVRQEQVSYKLVLEDGTEISVNAVYLSNKEGSGFSSFQLALGTM